MCFIFFKFTPKVEPKGEKTSPENIPVKYKNQVMSFFFINV